MSYASSHFESRSVKISARRSRVLSRPSRDFGSTAVVLLSGGVAPTDPRVANALAAMQSFFNVDLVMMTCWFKEVRKNYFIPPEYELHAPLPGERPYDVFPSGFSLLTNALEASLRFPLHLVIEACLEGWQISPFQMAPNSWHYMVAFLWEYYGSGVMTTRDLFMAYFCLSRGQARYYLTTRVGFRVGGAPSSNKGWKSHFFFISCRRGWCFPTEWTSQTGNNSVPVLSTDETELVEILRGILSASKGVKDMNEAWLVEAGLSPAPPGMFFLFVYHAECVFLIVPYHVEMFNLGKMKFGGETGNGSTVPSTTDAFASVVVAGFLAEKHPSIDEGSSMRKRNRRETSKQLADASGSTTRVPVEKGKESVVIEEAPERGHTLHELCEVEDRAGVKHFATVITRLKVAEGEAPLMSSSLAPSLTESMMRVGCLDGARNDRAHIEGDMLSLIEETTLLEVEGPRVVAAYKASRGFESGLGKMGRVSYEFEHRVALERLRGKHPEIEVEQDPFAECPEDANVEMDLSQPFNDSTPSK
ncbi:hypothetical protein BHM03_00029974 [Ensete ventricosum]|nr:hypothetical protein BHM03_00029974 [Ensete ventricosum]